MADIGCHPLWSVDDPHNIDPRSLPLTEETHRALGRWAAAHEANLDLDDPGSCGVSPTAAAAQEAEGRRLWRLLQRELGPQYEVLYHSESAAACIRADPGAAAAPPCVGDQERQRLRSIFERITHMEQGCAAGRHVRSLVAGPDDLPAGFAWLPGGLPEVPHLDHTRVVELRGPQGQELLFVPLSELAGVLRQAAADRGLSEERLRPLVSLEPGSPEVAVNGLMDLICRLVVCGAGPPVV